MCTVGAPEPVRYVGGVGNESLRRELGLLDAVGIGLGAIVGAGIFVVTGIAAAIAGPALLAGLLLAGLAATCNALSSAQLAAEYPRAGGTYEYGYRVLRPWLGFAAGWMFLASKIAAAGTVAIGLAAYLAALLPVPPRIVAVSAVIGFTILNYFGVRRSSRANLMIVAVSLGTLLLFVLAGLPSFRGENLRPFAPGGWRATLEAAALLFFAYTGYARIATLAEEVREPKRVIPRAIVITIVGALLLYFAVALVALAAAGAQKLASSAAPLQAAAAEFRQPWVVPLISIGAVTAMLGVILSQLLGLSRMAFAMARRGDLPRYLAYIHPQHGVPTRATVIIGSIAAVLAATGGLRAVASAAAFTILVYYAIANLAALRMPPHAKLFPDLIPLIGLVACIVLALSLPLSVIGSGVALLLVGLLTRLAVGRQLGPQTNDG